MERGGGEEAGEGAGVSNEGAAEIAPAPFWAGAAMAIPSVCWENAPRRCAVTVAGTVSATVAGSALQHDAASSDAEAAGESITHASQLEPARDSPIDTLAIGIGQTSRSPVRGAAPVTTKERRRRRLNLRRIMVLE